MEPKTYKIIVTETLVHLFYVEAENEGAALEEYNRMGEDGELDFSDGEVTDSTVTVELDDSNRGFYSLADLRNAEKTGNK